jgi:ABC-2 type transport system permease protein
VKVRIMSYPASSGFIALLYRQLKRWWNNRSRVIITIVNPLIWMVFLGLGWGGVFSPRTAPLIPGLPPAADMASFIAGISVIWDKQFGFLKETLVAPTPRSAIITGRIVGDATVATLQSLIIVTLGLILAPSINILNIPIALLYVFIMSLGFTSMGVAIVLKFSSMEGFQMVVNLINMPLTFLSGVFYPVTTMPEWMKAFSMVNSLTYCVHASRYWLTGSNVGFNYMNPLTDLAILSAFTATMLAIAIKDV